VERGVVKILVRKDNMVNGNCVSTWLHFHTCFKILLLPEYSPDLWFVASELS
jgi:hypothetical protein